MLVNLIFKVLLVDSDLLSVIQEGGPNQGLKRIMSKKIPGRAQWRIADEAARIILEEGVEDYSQAKLKACERLGLNAMRDLPRNDVIEHAIIERQCLFSADKQPSELRSLREVALKVMRSLREFEPQLAGAVLKGTANSCSSVQLHVFCDSVETVAIHLINLKISYRAIERAGWRGQAEGIPGFGFYWQGVPVEVFVFPQSKLRVAPPDPVDGKPEKRMGEQGLRELLDGEPV